MVQFDVKCGKQVGRVMIHDLDAFFKAGLEEAIVVYLLDTDGEYYPCTTIKSGIILVGLSEM